MKDHEIANNLRFRDTAFSHCHTTQSPDITGHRRHSCAFCSHGFEEVVEAFLDRCCNLAFLQLTPPI